MPADESRWRYDGKRFLPIEKPGPEHQRQPSRIAPAARPDLVILVVSQLLSQEQDFGSYGSPGTSDDVHKLPSIPQQFPDDDKNGMDVTLPSHLKSKH